MVVAMLLAVWLTIWRAPATAIGRFLTRLFVIAPAARLNRVRRGTVITLGVLLTLMVTGAWLFGHDFMQLFAMAAPDLTAAMTTFEVSAYIDAIVAVAVAASAVRWGALRTLLVQRMRRPRAARARRVRRPERKTANDDEEGAAIPLAA